MTRQKRETEVNCSSCGEHLATLTEDRRQRPPKFGKTTHKPHVSAWSAGYIYSWCPDCAKDDPRFRRVNVTSRTGC